VNRQGAAGRDPVTAIRNVVMSTDADHV